MSKKFSRTYELPFDKLGLNNLQIQKALGYIHQEAPPPFPDMIEQCLETVAKICTFKSGLVEYTLDDAIQEGFLLYSHDLAGRCIEFSVDKIIYQQLRKSEKILAFVSTAGKDISDWSKQLMAQGDLLEGYMVDVIGSEIVEAGMDIIHDEIEAYYKTFNLSVTNRYSPGYCGWHVSEQQKLFQFFPSGFIGVTLTPSSLMVPHKSISGLIGIGQHVRRIGYGCSLCDSENCLYRRLKAAPNS